MRYGRIVAWDSNGKWETTVTDQDGPEAPEEEPTEVESAAAARVASIEEEGPTEDEAGGTDTKGNASAG